MNQPPTMLTEVVVPGVVEPSAVIVRQAPVPAPGRGQALVRMLATGVSFAENSMLRGRYPGQPRFPFVLGYDLVGEVVAVGPGVDPGLTGRRVAALTRTGAWSTHVVRAARELITIDATLDPGEVETMVLNGITAWQMLHRSARVRAGETILVHGASGSVGATLLQLARHAGVRVIATGSERNHAALRELGAEPLDYHDPELGRRVSALAPDGVDAVFDNLGGESFTRSFHQLAPGGTLVGYGTAQTREDSDSMVLSFARILTRFLAWSVAPNQGRRATFYNVWAGSRLSPSRFHARLAHDLHQVLALLADGTLTAHVGARLPLERAGEALALADARTVRGKVILEP